MLNFLKKYFVVEMAIRTKVFIGITMLLLLCNVFVMSYTLTVDMDSAHGSVTVNGRTFTTTQYLTFYHNDTVTISATNDDGYSFEQWGAYYQNETTTPFTFTMTEDVYVEPTWILAPGADQEIPGNLTVNGDSFFKGRSKFYNPIEVKPETGSHYAYTLIDKGKIDLRWAGNPAYNMTIDRSGLKMNGLGHKLWFDLTDGLMFDNGRNEFSFDTGSCTFTIKSDFSGDFTTIQGGKINTDTITASDTLTLKPKSGTHYAFTTIDKGEIKLNWAGSASDNLTLDRSGFSVIGPGNALSFNTEGLDFDNYRYRFSLDGSTGSLTVRNNLQDHETVITGGNVSTETINADQITASEIVVTVDAHPDYVFKPGYDLKSLDEVQTFIHENGHLPGIPSEKDALENGLKIGEMQTKLLEKIEELTLHLIKMQDRVDELEAQLAQ